MFVIKDRPDKPPSAVSEVVPKQIGWAETWALLRDNKNFTLLLIAFSLPFGSFLAVGSLMSNIFDPFGFKPSAVAFVSLGLLVAGVTGAVIFGILLDKFKLYKFLMSFCAGVVCIASSLLMATMYMFPTLKAVISILLIIGGIFGTGYFPLCFAYSAELTFPMQPALIDGLMNLIGAVVAFLFGLAGSFLAAEKAGDDELEPEELRTVQQYRSIHVTSLMATATGIAFCLNLCIKEDLKRLNYKKEDDVGKDSDVFASKDSKQKDIEDGEEGEQMNV